MSGKGQRICEYCGTIIPPGATICPACEAEYPILEDDPGFDGGNAPDIDSTVNVRHAPPVGGTGGDVGSRSAGQVTGSYGNAPDIDSTMNVRHAPPVGGTGGDGGAQSAGQVTGSYGNAPDIDSTVNVRHAPPAGGTGGDVGSRSAGQVTGSYGNAPDIDSTVNVRHAPPAGGTGGYGGAQSSGQVTGSYGNAPDIDSTVNVRHAPPMGGTGGYGGAQSSGQVTGSYGNAPDIDSTMNVRHAPPMGGTGGYGDVPPAGGAPQSGIRHPQRQNVDSFTGSSGGNATVQRAMQIAEEKQFNDGSGSAKSKKWIFIVPVAAIAIVLIAVMLINRDKESEPDMYESAMNTDKTESEETVEAEETLEAEQGGASTGITPIDNLLNEVQNSDDFFGEGDSGEGSEGDASDGYSSQGEASQGDESRDSDGGVVDEYLKSESMLGFMTANNLKITPQGEFSFTTMNSTTEEDLEEVTLPTTVSITENTDGVIDGYKEVILEGFFDLSDAVNDEGAKPFFWYTALDRYSGIYFEFSEDTETDENGLVKIESSIPGKDLYVNTEFEKSYEYPIMYGKITVTCPEWYDGTIFQIGYNSRELSRKTSDIVTEARPYRIDETPYTDAEGHDYYYFSLNDK
ncbi:MAG: hypothetical protein K6B28_04540 [Lachnospiraceae bacterium]|nr:hypothetical protein [Lachnospiraceae bacterium]